MYEREILHTKVMKETGYAGVISFYPLIRAVSPSSGVIPSGFLNKIL
jgi:hypothetical protein